MDNNYITLIHLKKGDKYSVVGERTQGITYRRNFIRKTKTRCNTLNIMRNEKECIIRQSEDRCDKNCGECEFNVPSEKAVKAYSNVIRILESIKEVD